MELRLATMNDLPKLKQVYKNIIEDMNYNNISIWDEVYPCEFFENDIANNRLYVLTNSEEDIVGAFAVCASNSGERFMNWESPNAKAVYIDRLGVNVTYHHQGIGTILLYHATEIARQMSAEYVRLFVVDINQPAIKLYLKNGFTQLDDIYVEIINDNLSFQEYGFEKKV